jgi:hypothetical protein
LGDIEMRARLLLLLLCKRAPLLLLGAAAL